MDNIITKKRRRKCGIYIIKFRNGKYYIGKTTDFDERMCSYRRCDCKRQIKLYNALRKYGWDSVQVTFIEYPEELLDVNETTLIAAYNSVKEGYNIRGGGQGGRHSEETKRKMSIAAKGRKHKHSEKSKKKISETLKRKYELKELIPYGWKGGDNRLCFICKTNKVYTYKNGTRSLSYCIQCKRKLGNESHARIQKQKSQNKYGGPEGNRTLVRGSTILRLAIKRQGQKFSKG